MGRGRSFAVIAVVLLTSSGCRAAHGVTRTPTQGLRPSIRFVLASAALQSECRATARSVGYAVPCPLRVPEIVLPGHTPMRLHASVAVGSSPCTLDVVGLGCGRWKGWVVGSSGFGYDNHLVITASPVPFRNAAKIVNGPAWYPQARVRPLR